MKKVLLYVFILLGALFAFGIVNTDAIKNPRKLVFYSPCDVPLTYKIGSIDSRFGISSAELQSTVVEAEKVWEDIDGRNLFLYDPKAELSVNMVYDERQSLNQQIGQLEKKITQDKSAVDSQIQSYESKSAYFRKKLSDFNKQVDEWNSKGGAPKDEFEKLKVQQQELQKESDELSAMANSLNLSASEFNSEIGKLNTTVDSFNSALQLRPEQGLYNGLLKTIDIYITSSHTELMHTLAHELGHAIAMDHVQGEGAIMYTSTSESIGISSEDRKELAYVCRERTVLEGLREKIGYLVQKYRATSQK